MQRDEEEEQDETAENRRKIEDVVWLVIQEVTFNRVQAVSLLLCNPEPTTY